MRRAHSIAVASIIVGFVGTLLLSCRHAQQAHMPSAEPRRTLLEFFQARGVLVEQSPYTNRLVGLLADQAAPSCGLSTPLGYSQGLTTNKIEVHDVNLPADFAQFCSQSPDPQGCESIFDRCASFERTIFCDRRFVQRVFSVASITFTHVINNGFSVFASRTTEATTPPSPELEKKVKILERLTGTTGATPEGRARINDFGRLSGLFTNELTDALKLAVDLRHADDLSAVRAGPALVDFPQSLLPRTHDTLVGFVLGHEFAHLEQRACPSTIHVPWQHLMKSYSSFVCETTSHEELEADMRGAILTKVLLQLLHSVTDINSFSKLDKDESLTRTAHIEEDLPVRIDLRASARWTLENYDLMGALAMIHFLEIQLMLELFGDDAPKIADGEPCASDCAMVTADTYAALGKYYRRAAAQAEIWSGGARSYRSHMMSPLRFLLTSRMSRHGTIEAYANQKKLPTSESGMPLVAVWVGVRLKALVEGSLDATQGSCKRSPVEKSAAFQGLMTALDEAGSGLTPGNN